MKPALLKVYIDRYLRMMGIPVINLIEMPEIKEIKSGECHGMGR
jgi:hypothetical protein